MTKARNDNWALVEKMSGWKVQIMTDEVEHTHLT